MMRKLNNHALKRPDHVLFCRVRNEDYFIRHFLTHYRAIGIEHFYFADDRSDDGTREYLLTQPDCTVIEADFRFSEMIDDVKGKDYVMRAVPEQFIGDGWTVSVDADEFMVLPEIYGSIGDLTRDLEGRGQVSCVASMVDFYPANLAGRFADRALSPFAAFPFFDVGPYFIWEQGQIHPIPLHAGVRHRINEWIFERDGPRAFKVYRPTMLHKVPLLRWGHGILPNPSHRHSSDVPPYTATQLVLAHFKFYPDLDAKIREGLESNFYHSQSFYYRLLDRYLPLVEKRSLIGLTSRRYRTPADLERAHLLFANGRPF
jgi:hypothetical protein